MHLTQIVAAFSLAMPAAVEAQSTQPEVIVPEDGRFAVPVNGTTVVAQALPDGSSYPALSPALARQLGLKTDFLGSLVKVAVLIGPQRVSLQTGYARVFKAKRRVIWPDRPLARNAAMELGPDAIPSPRVTFRLTGKGAGNRTLSFPLEREDSLSGTRVNFGGHQVFISFAPYREETLATAPAAQVLASLYDGELHGTPALAELPYSIARPIRQLALQRTPEVGGLALRQVWARTKDFGSVIIPDRDADPTEIVVQGGKRSGKNLYRIAVGRADLAGCSAITFDKPARRIVLTC